MNAEEYNKALDAVCKDIKSSHSQIMILLATSAIMLIKKRVQQTGTDAKGNRFRKYSQWYEKYKTEKGKFKGFTDFSFTNRMWTDIQLISSDEKKALITAKDKGTTGSNVQVQVVRKKTANKLASKNNPRTTYTKNIYVPSNYEKLEKNTQSFGPILELSEKEIEILKQTYNSLIMDIFRKYGLAI
jgi:hypothetical protein